MSKILITGCPRSGTTVVAKILSKHGANFGRAVASGVATKGLMADGSETTVNNLEDPVFITTSECVLNLSGGIWFFPPDFINASCSTPNIVEDIMEGNLDGNIAIKDPHVSILYPFWKDVLKDFHIIYLIRHPMSVARSLHNMNYQPYTTGLNVWKRYLSDMIMYDKTYNLNVSFIDYPTLKGLRSAFDKCGIKLDKAIVDSIFDKTRLMEPEELPVMVKHFQQIYESIVENIDD